MEFLKKNAGLIIFVGILLIVVCYVICKKEKKEESGFRWPWQKKYVRNEYDVEKVSF